MDPHPKDKFNLSNDNFYEVSKDGIRHRVRQTFGQLVVEHAYPAQKLQLPFVCRKIIHFKGVRLIISPQYKTRLNKQEARSFHRPALQFPSNVELRFNKVRSAKKKKDRAGRKVGKGGNVSEGLHKSADLSLKDTSNYVLLEYSVRPRPVFGEGHAAYRLVSFRKNIPQFCQTSAWVASSSTIIERRTIRMSTFPRCGRLCADDSRSLTINIVRPWCPIRA